MSAIKLVGKAVSYEGKTLWEILGNLKNLGAGRIVIRNRFQHYPEPCYFKILKAQLCLPIKDEKRKYEPTGERHVTALVEEVFRGKKAIELRQLEPTTYKADYKLIPREEEYKFLNGLQTQPGTKVLPRKMGIPPLMEDLLRRQMKQEGEVAKQKLQIEVVYRESHVDIRNYRIAKEGETPNYELDHGIKLTKATTLYANVKYDEKYMHLMK